MEIPKEIQNQSQTTTKNTKKEKERESSSPKYDWNSGSEYLGLSDKQIQTQLEAMRQRQLRSKGEPKKVPYDPKLAAYFDSLHEKKERKIEYGDARIEFYLMWKEVIFGSRNTNQIPYLHESDTENVRQFVKWIIQDESCELDLDKGILMIGTQGCGKTTLMKTGRMFLNKYTQKTYGMKRINDIMFEVEKKKSIAAVEPYFKGNWCFDDIGQMNEDVVVYSKHNIVEMLINRRVESKSLTLGTTNLAPDDFGERYGKVVRSRMNQMFNPMVFESNQDCREL